MITVLSLLFCLVVVVATVGIVTLGWFVLRPVRKLVARAANWFGPDAQTRLVGLGIVAYLFPSTVTAAVYRPLRLVAKLFESCFYSSKLFLSVLTTEWMQRSIPEAELRDQEGWERTAEPILAALQATLRGPIPYNDGFVDSELASVLSATINSWLLVALGLWACLGQAMGRGRPLVVQPAMDWFRDLDEAGRSVFWLVVVFLAGSYLCVAAIVAIPWLEENSVVGLSETTTLREELDDLLGGEENVHGLLPTDYLEGQDPDSQLSREFGTATQTGATPPQPVLEQITDAPTRNEVGRQKAMLDTVYNGLRRDWPNLRSQVLTARRNVLQECLNAYERNVHEDFSAIERADYRRELYNWSQRQLQYVEEDAERLRRRVDGFHSDLREWARDVRRVASATDANRVTPYEPWTRGVEDRSSHDFSLDVPPLPRRDVGLGPFGFFAKWLVQTRSLSLALITGMIGFGLLGAVGGVFVRRMRTEDVEPVGVASILVGGVSAAVIVFLAARGGLAIFGSSDVQPNGYVLFFTCLVGAGYSEVVWGWAGRELDNRLRRGGGSGDSESGDDESGNDTVPGDVDAQATDDVSLESIGVSARTLAILAENGVGTLADLLGRTREQIDSFSGIGPSRLAEIEAALLVYSLQLADGWPVPD